MQSKKMESVDITTQTDSTERTLLKSNKLLAPKEENDKPKERISNILRDTYHMLSAPNNGQTDKAAAFRKFCASYPDARVFDENSKILKEKMKEAKSLGILVNDSRDKISNG